MELENITNPQRKEVRRRYDDACGLAYALELIGERWALLVMRELMFGPRRFSELKADLPGISANVLTQRLAELEQRGLVRRTRLPPPALVQVYEATEWGLEAAPVLRSLGKWAVRSQGHDPTLPVSHVSIMMSMQTMFDGECAQGMNAQIGFRFGQTSYLASIQDGSFDARRGETDGADVVFSGEPAQMAAVLYGGAPLETVAVEGDMGLARRFTTLFPLPQKVPTS
jgi:DNA-binding HxlR family transcriptional regulator